MQQLAAVLMAAAFPSEHQQLRDQTGTVVSLLRADLTSLLCLVSLGHLCRGIPSPQLI